MRRGRMPSRSAPPIGDLVVTFCRALISASDTNRNFSAARFVTPETTCPLDVGHATRHPHAGKGRHHRWTIRKQQPIDGDETNIRHEGARHLVRYDAGQRWRDGDRAQRNNAGGHGENTATTALDHAAASAIAAIAAATRLWPPAPQAEQSANPRGPNAGRCGCPDRALYARVQVR